MAAYEGAVAGAAELLIQPFVYAHKNEIGSPYELEDALAAIGTAALGSAALGGGVAGMVGYLRNAAKIADDYPQHVGAQGSKEALNRMADDLEANPGRTELVDDIDLDVRHFYARTNEEIAQEILDIRSRGPVSEDDAIRIEAARAVVESRKGRWGDVIQREIDAAVLDEKARLTAGTSERLTRGERKQLREELTELVTRRNQVEPDSPKVVKQKGVPARKAKAEAVKRAKLEAETEVAELTRQIDAIEQRLESSSRGSRAESDLTRAEQGIYSQGLKDRIAEIKHHRLVEMDAEYARTIEKHRSAQASTRAKPEHYGVDLDSSEPVMTREQLEEGDNILAARFAEDSDDVQIVISGESMSVKSFIQEQDDLIAEMEAARACQYG